MEEKLKELRTRLLEINDLQMAAAVLEWDQTTYMPSGGAEARGRQMATLNRMAREKFVDESMGKLLDELQPYAKSLPEDSDKARLITVTRRQYDRDTRVPTEVMAEFYVHAAHSYQVWTKARPENDFAAVQPNLEKTLDLCLKYSSYFPDAEHPADPFIDNADYGMKAESIRKIFGELREELVPLVKAIAEQEPADDACLRQTFPEEGQLAFSLKVVEQFGYDLTRGRVDKTHHPFTTKFALDDVRITNKVIEDYLGMCLFSTFHEAGHALYELNIDKEKYKNTPLGQGTSAGVHESSSRMWENIVGRSRNFWSFYYPKLQEVFPSQLKNVPLDTFYRAINKVQPSLIRVLADEVTYNLHVMIRFDLELAMLEGKLAIKDLPDAWHARYQSDLGVQAPSNMDGCLQDVHWFMGSIGGMFQGYTLGNILTGIWHAAAIKDHPEIPTEISQGKFDTLLAWLTENIYKYGSKYTTEELVRRITGGRLTVEPYMEYLRNKFGELYDL